MYHPINCLQKNGKTGIPLSGQPAAETLVDFYWSTQRHISEDSFLPDCLPTYPFYTKLIYIKPLLYISDIDLNPYGIQNRYRTHREQFYGNRDLSYLSSQLNSLKHCIPLPLALHTAIPKGLIYKLESTL
jgi:hypothetical protein